MRPAWASRFPDEWTWHDLADLCFDVVDCPHSTPEVVETGPYLMARTSDVLSGIFRTDIARRVSEATFRERTQRATPQFGDLLYSREGTYFGLSAEVPPQTSVCLGQRMVLLRPDARRLHPTYLRFFLNSPQMQSHVHGQRDGSVAERLNLPTIRRLEICTPPIEEQRAIAHILGALDDKIELNRRMNETLEAIARALFKSWFVDFDPVRAKAEGRDPGLPPAIADLFPSSFEDSELGEIPAGWRVGKFGDVAEHPRRTIQPSVISTGTPYIALEHMPRGSIALTEWETGDGLESNKYEFKRGEILFGKLRPYFHKAGVAPIDGVCSTDIVVVAPRKPEWFGFVLGHASSLAFVDYTNAGSTGTKMPRTNWSDMSRYAIALPPENIAAAFDDRVSPSVSRINMAIHESRTLAALRDTLLPKLISGELRVKDADRVVGVAV